MLSTTFLSALLAGVSLAGPFAVKHNHHHNQNITHQLESRSVAGTATHYPGNLDGGACSFTGYTIPEGLYGIAWVNWDNSYNCGGCVQVTNPNGVSITAMIVDRCIGTCGDNGLDLFPDAFAVMDPGSGRFPVTWEYRQCPTESISDPLRIHLQSGVTQYWFSAHVVNANRRTAHMEVSTDGGATWMPTVREDYNYFVIEQGTGTGNVDVRVTSHVGSVVIVPNVPVFGDAVATAAKNYD